MNEIIVKEKERIYIVRGKLVMLDSDLARVYGFANGTKAINLIVKRHSSSFNDSVYFQLNQTEFNDLKFQFETSSFNNYGGVRKLPYVFTYEGIEVLNSIIRRENKEIIFAKIKNAFQEKNSSNNELALIKPKEIRNLIYEFRGKQVMLDSDLAMLYKCKNGTKEINQAVKNNLEKFPERYSFRLTKEESASFLVKNFDQKNETRGRKYTNPRVFTEQGVAMLATILKSDVATKVSIAIMDAFVAMRNLLKQNPDIFANLNNINYELIKHSKELDKHEKLINEIFNKFANEEKSEMLFFEGQVYDAYSKLLDIMKKAKNTLVIIDSYADKTVLDMISTLKSKVILIAKEHGNLKSTDIKKYNTQYTNLNLIYNNSFHDRYLILDYNSIYHCGASLNQAGRKTFSINKLEDKKIISLIINEIKGLN